MPTTQSIGPSGSDKAPLCDDIPRGGIRRVTLNGAAREARSSSLPLSGLVLSFYCFRVRLQRTSDRVHRMLSGLIDWNGPVTWSLPSPP
jgi:hypothetical protein